MRKIISFVLVLLFAATAFSCALKPQEDPAGMGAQTDDNGISTQVETAAETSAEADTVKETKTPASRPSAWAVCSGCHLRCS